MATGSRLMIRSSVMPRRPHRSAQRGLLLCLPGLLHGAGRLSACAACLSWKGRRGQADLRHRCRRLPHGFKFIPLSRTDPSFCPVSRAAGGCFSFAFHFFLSVFVLYPLPGVDRPFREALLPRWILLSFPLLPGRY